MHSFCKNNNYPAYIDYGNEPPPAATTGIQPNSRIPNVKRHRIDHDNRNSESRVCTSDTCANKGVCKEAYEDDIMNAAFVRQEYAIDNEKDSKWAVASLIHVCDCDLTTYTGPTCKEGNEICIHIFLVASTRIR